MTGIPGHRPRSKALVHGHRDTELGSSGHSEASESFIGCNIRESPNNVLLILCQAPWATRVAGYRKWQEMGRQVRKGERGIAVLAPCTYKTGTDEHDAPEEAEPRKVLRGFRVVHVFDVSQTDGEPLPSLDAPLLDGEAPAALWDGLAAQVAAAGFELERGDCGGANGRTDYLGRVVRVRVDVESAQATKTLAHDLLSLPM